MRPYLRRATRESASGFAMDLAAHIGHVALRTYVMGERGVANEPATSEDIAEMAKLAAEAVEAGALGFSTSRVQAHVTLDGDPVPGTTAGKDELFAIGRAIADTGRPVVFQVAEAGVDGQDPNDALSEMAWMRELSAELKIPVSFLVLQSMILRLPLGLKKYYAPTLFPVEALVSRLQGKRLSCMVACQWKKKGP